MRWKDQSGVTLVELLAAIAILSIIIFPILTLMTNSSTRTVIQGKESQMLYFAQEVMETYKVDTSLSNGEYVGFCSIDAGCIPSVDESIADASYVVTVSNYPNPYSGSSTFNQIIVSVTSLDVVTNDVELVTVVKSGES
jgi:prepilin-type N-terminal cleavage/methylation domain-containing protein